MTVNGMNMSLSTGLAGCTSLTLDETSVLNSIFNMAAIGMRRKMTPMLFSGNFLISSS